ncbi:MAG: GDSL-type esterase/lipase family protein [Opitutaceae bacterium]|jgi:lysophospholipase L1-like esterase
MTPKILLHRVLLLAAVFSAVSVGRADDAFYLKDGDRVVFYGDSITDQRLYTTFTETFVVTRFPNLKVDFVHSGWGGDRVGGGGGGNIATRLERDVFTYKPTVMTVMLGMNDGSYRAFDDKIFATYDTGLRSIVEKVQSTLPGIRLTLIQPSPFDDVTRDPKFPGGYNAVLVRYADAVKAIAEANHQTVADLNSPLVAMLEKAKAADAQSAAKIIPDRVHPGASGHLIMAEQVLKAWNAPSLVSGVEIDASAGKVVHAMNTNVSALKIAADSAEWTQLDKALPMPVDLANPETALAVKSSDFVEALDRQPLRVTGLKTASYELQIDGRKIGVFASVDLAAGINLAVLATPMAAQAAEVHKLTLQRANLHNIRWRAFQVPYANATPAVKEGLPAVIESLDAADRAAAVMQRASAQPVAHQFKLIALSAETVALQGDAIDTVPADFGLNLALGKKWQSSAPNTYGWDSGLTDGSWAGANKTTYATNDSSAFPKTVTVDLEAASKIGRIVVGVPGFGSTKTIEVSVSADGAQFTTVGRYGFSLKKEEKHLFAFEMVTARYVRLTYLDHHDEQAGYPVNFAFTSDLQVFAPAAK